MYKWCHDCKDYVEASKYDDSLEEYACHRCGSLILCDDCGQPYTDDHYAEAHPDVYENSR